jgi:methionyl-tRNA formyltransferase
VTLFRLLPGVDTGPILETAEEDIGPQDTAGDIEERLAVKGAALALKVVDRYAAGEDMTGTPQDNSQATRAPKLKKEDGDIDWSRSAAQVCCQVRAMHPWPTAYTHWLREGQQPLRMIVHSAMVADPAPAALGPGEILAGDNSAMLVGAGDGTVVRVVEIQPAGKKRMPAADYLRGRRPLPGDRLGRVPS